MRTHHAIRPAAPGFTGGGDEQRANCADRPWAFDTLVDRSHGPASLVARQRVLEICGACPIRQACWDAAHESGADWFYALRGKERPRNPQPNNLRSATARANAKARHERKHRERIETLRELIAAGAGRDEVLARMDLTRSALYKWCQNNGYLDEWQTISRRQEVAA